MKDEKLSVKEAGIAAVGAVVGRSEDPEASLRGIEKYLLSPIFFNHFRAFRVKKKLQKTKLLTH